MGEVGSQSSPQNKRSKKMRKFIIFVIVTLVLYGFMKINESLSDKMYSDCMTAGKQSEETCYKYAYLQ